MQAPPLSSIVYKSGKTWNNVNLCHCLCPSVAWLFNGGQRISCYASPRSIPCTKNLGSEQYPQNGNLLICSTLEVGELTSQYISRLRIVTKIKKIPGKSLTLGDSNVFCTFTNLNQGGKSDFSANQDFWSRWSLTCIYHLPLNLADDKLVAVGGFQTFQG